MAASRVKGTTYWNLLTYPIVVAITGMIGTGGADYVEFWVGGVQVYYSPVRSYEWGQPISFSVIVPPKTNYVFWSSALGGYTWCELF